MTATPAEPSTYLTINEVASLLHVSRHTVLRRIQQDAFPGAFQTAGYNGGHWRIPRASVEAFTRKADR